MKIHVRFHYNVDTGISTPVFMQVDNAGVDILWVKPHESTPALVTKHMCKNSGIPEFQVLVFDDRDAVIKAYDDIYMLERPAWRHPYVSNMDLYRTDPDSDGIYEEDIIIHPDHLIRENGW
jgi:hypothetical protein